MIKIKFPACSQRLSVTEIETIKPESGFYFMRDPRGQVIYVGEALDLRKRLTRHMTGKSTTTKRFYHVFHSIDVFYCHRKERKIYETHAINLYNPIGNVDNNESASRSELIERREGWIRSLQGIKKAP